MWKTESVAVELPAPKGLIMNVLENKALKYCILLYVYGLLSTSHTFVF